MHVADFLLRCFITCWPPPGVLTKAAMHSRDARKLLEVLLYEVVTTKSPPDVGGWIFSGTIQ